MIYDRVCWMPQGSTRLGHRPDPYLVYNFLYLLYLLHKHLTKIGWTTKNSLFCSNQPASAPHHDQRCKLRWLAELLFFHQKNKRVTTTVCLAPSLLGAGSCHLSGQPKCILFKALPSMKKDWSRGSINPPTLGVSSSSSIISSERVCSKLWPEFFQTNFTASKSGWITTLVQNQEQEIWGTDFTKFWDESQTHEQQHMNNNYKE